MRLAVPDYLRLGAISAQICTPCELGNLAKVRRRFCRTIKVAAIILVATASSGLPVSYCVNGPATVMGSRLTLTGPGQVTIMASQSGNGTYSPAIPVTRISLVTSGGVGKTSG